MRTVLIQPPPSFDAPHPANKPRKMLFISVPLVESLALALAL